MTRGARRVLLAALAAAVFAVTGPTAAPAEAAKLFRVVAGPGATSLGYATPAVVMLRGKQLWFTNLDTVLHNVVSTTPGLFGSPLVGLNATVAVSGTPNLPNGKYSFFCTLHHNMTGKLTVKG